MFLKIYEVQLCSEMKRVSILNFGVLAFVGSVGLSRLAVLQYQKTCASLMSSSSSSPSSPASIPAKETIKRKKSALYTRTGDKGTSSVSCIHEPNSYCWSFWYSYDNCHWLVIDWIASLIDWLICWLIDCRCHVIPWLCVCMS